MQNVCTHEACSVCLETLSNEDKIVMIVVCDCWMNAHFSHNLS